MKECEIGRRKKLEICIAEKESECSFIHNPESNGDGFVGSHGDMNGAKHVIFESLSVCGQGRAARQTSSADRLVGCAQTTSKFTFLIIVVAVR